MGEVSGVTAGDVILRVLDKAGGPVHSTKLVKLTYLLDYLHFQYFGRTVTGFLYMWDHFGPNAVGHAIVEEARKLVKKGVAVSDCYPNIYGGQTIDFTAAPDAEVTPLPAHVEMLIDDIIKQYGHLSIEDITNVSKQTEPFRTAAQYSLLSMKHSAPARGTPESDWEAYQRDLRENGTLSLDEVKKRYGLA